MDRTKTAWLAAALVCALGGCGTIGNLADPSRTKPFGGVMRDGEASSWLMNEFSEASKKPVVEKAGLVVAAPIVTIDLPLSLVADTVTLPLTIPVALLRQEQPEPLREPGPRKPTSPSGNEKASVDPSAVSNFVPCTSLSGAAHP